MLITFTLNGQSQTLASGTSVSALLKELSLPARFVIEKNHSLLPKSQWSSTMIENDDKIEIITAVGGG
jgi:thiamine biosynthesis protein ThiS